MRPGLGTLIVLLSLSPVQAQSGISPSRERAAVIAAVDRARAEKDVRHAEYLLREALQKWPEDTTLESYLAAVLFATERLDESYAHMRNVCSKSGFEGACASSVGIDLVKNRWERAIATASNFNESACQRSDRLWTLKQLARSPEHAVAAGKHLVTVEPDKETSYLFLAAAQWRLGQHGEARKTLALGRTRATVVVLLKEKIAWDALEH